MDEEMAEIDAVQIHQDYPKHEVWIGAQLDFELKEKLIHFLIEHHDCFAWSYKDMTSINPNIIVHRLQVDPEYPPRKQKQSKFTPKRIMSSTKKFESPRE